ncbi:MAG TPA: hypothetical protein VNG53_01430 [Bacteroidia bacterium]|nr:hypothetical protein [Bacteroidia bacterium]
MKKILLIALTIGLLGACTASKKEASSNSTTTTENASTKVGLSIETAVVIKDKNETDGVNSEYAWINVHYPDYTTKSQELLMVKNKPYDKIDIKTKEGKALAIYFDISNFFGKF